jgi:hypothetical protein
LTNLVDAKFFISGVAPLPTDAYVSEIRQDSRSVFDDNVITIGKDSQTTSKLSSAAEAEPSRGQYVMRKTIQCLLKGNIGSRCAASSEPYALQDRNQQSDGQLHL